MLRRLWAGLLVGLLLVCGMGARAVTYTTFSLLSAPVSQIGQFQALGGGTAYFNAGGGVAQMLAFDIKSTDPTDLQFLNGNTGGSTCKVYIDGSLKWSEGTSAQADGTISFLNGEFHAGATLTPFDNATPANLLTANTWHTVVIVNPLASNYLRTTFAVIGGSASIRGPTALNWLPPGGSAQNGSQVVTQAAGVPATGLLLEPIQHWYFGTGVGSGVGVAPTISGGPNDVAPNNYGNDQSFRIRTPIGATAVGIVCNNTAGHANCVVFVDGVEQAIFTPDPANGLTKLITGTNASSADAYKLCDVPNDGAKHIVDIFFIEQGMSIGMVWTAGGSGGIDTTFADHRPIAYIGGDSITNGASSGDSHYHDWYPARLYAALNFQYCIINGGLAGTFIDTAYGTTSAINRAVAIKAFISASQSTVNPVRVFYSGWGTNDWADILGTIGTAQGGTTDALYNARYAAQVQALLTALDPPSNLTVKYKIASPVPRTGLAQLGGPRYSVIGPTFPATAGHDQYYANTLLGVNNYLAAHPCPNVFAGNLDSFAPGGPTIMSVDGSGHYQDLVPDTTDTLHPYNPSGSTKIAVRAAAFINAVPSTTKRKPNYPRGDRNAARHHGGRN